MNILLQIQDAHATLKTHPLPNGVYTLGSLNCDLSLNYPTVSRLHAKIKVENQFVKFFDCSSKNGSYLANNNTKIQPDTEYEWIQNEKLKIGPFLLSWSIDKTNEKTKDLDDWLLQFASEYENLITLNNSQALTIIENRIKTQVPSSLHAHLLNLIVREFHGNGPLEEALSDSNCREIVINSFNEIYLDQGAALFRSKLSFVSAKTYEAWVLRMVQQSNKQLDLQHPICEATLSNGERMQAVLSPISAQNLCVTIRKFGSAPITEKAALQSGWVDETALTLLKAAVKNHMNIVIAGGTSTGKTSLLNFLCQYIDPNERLVTIEDTLELQPPVTNRVQLQARRANSDDKGAINLTQLLQCALRLRPDRIVVGECRGSEVLDMLQALNTGHPGSMTTVHANSCNEALTRIELLALLGSSNLSTESIRYWIQNSIHLVVQLKRNDQGLRYVSEIAKIVDQNLERIYERPVLD